MGTTEQGATNMAPEAVNEVVSTERNSVVIETPKPAEPEPVQSDADKQRATIDRMGNELGSLRKELAEARAMLGQQTQVANEPQEVTFEDNPQAFIEQTIQRTLESSLAPKLQILENDLLNRQSAKFDEKLSETFPDWKETVKGDSFADWVQANPARMQMYQLADQQYDVASAAELLKRYKDDVANAEADKQGAIGAAGLVQSSGDTGGARVYAASEISEMLRSDPAAYRRFMSGDGMRAYQEGRVDQNR